MHLQGLHAGPQNDLQLCAAGSGAIHLPGHDPDSRNQEIPSEEIQQDEGRLR